MPRPSPDDILAELRIPVYRTRMMMKSSPDVDCVSTESVVCLTKATELFIQQLLQSALGSSKSKSDLTYSQLCKVQQQSARYAFLADVLPDKIKARDWIEKYKADFEASCK